MHQYRLKISLTIQHQIYIHQFDVTTSYLNRELKEEVFIERIKLIKKTLKYIIEHETQLLPIRKKAKIWKGDIKVPEKIALSKKSLFGLK